MAGAALGNSDRDSREDVLAVPGLVLLAESSEAGVYIVLSEDRCYAVNQGGDAFVFKASPKFELLATNSMGEKFIGSIAVSDGHLFMRGHKHLFCIGK